jgi:hypothetical protein
VTSEPAATPPSVHDQAYASIQRAERGLLDSYQNDVGHELELADQGPAD